MCFFLVVMTVVFVGGDKWIWLVYFAMGVVGTARGACGVKSRKGNKKDRVLLKWC